MAFVVSEGKLLGLDRPNPPHASSISLAADFSADYATIWKTQPHVRTVIGFLARNIAQIGLHTFERTSDTDRRRLNAVDNPLAALLTKPNARTTRYRLIDALVNDLGIFDVACWVKSKPADSALPAGLLRLPPQQIEPLGDSWAWPEGVRFKGTKGHMDLGADDVVLFRGYNPTDARWGVSPMETLRRVLAEEYQATLYREQLWRNGARFPGHIQRPAGAAWSNEARERFRADWKGLYTGSGPGAGGTPVLEDGMTFEAGGITPAQAQYLETRKLTREEVAAAFHIPLPMVGILDHATFSNIKEQHQNLYQDTLGPWLEMIQQEIGLRLVSDFDATGKVYVEFNLAEKMKGSFEEQATSLQTAVGAPWLTRNEARARQNLPQVDGGDALVTPLNVLTGGQSSPTDSGSQNSSSAPQRGAKSGERVKARAPETHEQQFREVLSAFFGRQSRSVLSRIGSETDWWDGDRWDGELSADLYRLTANTSETVARQALAAAGFSDSDYDVDRTLAFLAEASRRDAENINATTRDQLDAEMGLEDGDTSNVFEVAQTSRAEQIATTAVTFASSFGTVEAARQNSTGATKTWRTTSSNPRASHARMNGETVPLDEDFSNGLAWPGGIGDPDETAGCRCEMDINF